MPDKITGLGLNFFHQQNDANEVEKQLERYAIAIGFDYENEQQAHLLAIEFKEFTPEKAKNYFTSGNRTLMAKAEFFALAQVMLTLMKDGAEEGIHIHGGNCWKSFARELYKLGY